MDDTEALNLIEHYKWEVHHSGGLWFVGDGNGMTLRDAIKSAMAAQARKAFAQSKKL